LNILSLETFQQRGEVGVPSLRSKISRKQPSVGLEREARGQGIDEFRPYCNRHTGRTIKGTLEPIPFSINHRPHLPQLNIIKYIPAETNTSKLSWATNNHLQGVPPLLPADRPRVTSPPPTRPTQQVPLLKSEQVAGITSTTLPSPPRPLDHSPEGYPPCSEGGIGPGRPRPPSVGPSRIPSLCPLHRLLQA
jgi:hypothetical protein